MSLRGTACIAGAYEHPTRKAPDKTVAQLHAECAAGALADAGLTKGDVDGYFCAADAPGMGPLAMADYMNLRLRHLDSTELGGSSYIAHVGHAAAAIAAGRCNVALITLAGRPRSEGHSGAAARPVLANAPESPWEAPFGPNTVNLYAMCAMRHMHEFGTTAEQLASIKVAASHHAQHNPNAMLRDVVTVDEVVGSPVIADPLHRLDCCVVSDGGGALVVTRPEIARSLARPVVTVVGTGEAHKGLAGGNVDLTYSGARWSGPAAFAEAGVAPADIRYASIYDSFTITVLMQLEDLGFCEKGSGGAFVADGNLISGVGRLAVNTDGGGLCNNHPANRGGMTKVIEAVRQLRGEAHPAVQVPDLALALAHGTGGMLGGRHGSSTLILERRDPMSERTLPDPPVTPESAPFYEAARGGRFLLRRCASCGQAHWYPRALCPFCFGETAWKEASGRGTIYSYSVMRRVKPAYVVAYVTLAEGATMLTNLVECDPDGLAIGQDVEVAWRPSDGGIPVPCFRPTDRTAG